MAEKKLKIFRIYWTLNRVDNRVSLILDYSEIEAIDRFARGRGIFYKKYVIDKIEEIEKKPRYLGDHFA